MSTIKTTEHFCTLFDYNFLPMGMTLHYSLMMHAQPFHLWILCMDSRVEKYLQQLALPHITLIPLQDVETPELLAVKAERSKGEYCWTLTPFTFESVFTRDPSVQQVTYLDADLFFFDDPRVLLQELSLNRKEVLITEHAYAPEYDQSLISGRFCVQFITFKRTDAAAHLMHWWQNQCLEWCFNRCEDGKFGDQKYLDSWPTQFDHEVHIVQQVEKTLAPWNINFFAKQQSGNLNPVFYHFHGFRITSPNHIQLFFGYRIGNQGLGFYEKYISSFLQNIIYLQNLGISIPYISPQKGIYATLRYWKYLVTGKARYRQFSL
jgi:hypothetical protein